MLPHSNGARQQTMAGDERVDWVFGRSTVGSIGFALCTPLIKQTMLRSELTGTHQYAGGPQYLRVDC
jgi:hypothetical protein